MILISRKRDWLFDITGPKLLNPPGADKTVSRFVPEMPGEISLNLYLDYRPEFLI